MQPGQTVSPGGTPENPSWQFHPDSNSQPQPVAPVNESLPPVQQPSAPAAPPQQPVPVNSNGISWTASEFIAHAKSTGWYMALIFGALAVTALVYILTKDKISSAVVIVVAMIFAIVAARKPRELQYQVDDQGIHIANKTYLYKTFRSFAVVQEEGIESIWFMPLKRFMPIVSIYFDPKDGDKIVDMLSQYLPFEDKDLDPVDRLMHRLRF